MKCRSRIAFLLTLLIASATLAAQPCGDQEYISWMSNLVRNEKASLGGVANMMPISIPVAQSVLETGYGSSFAAQKRNNFFGVIRAKGGTKRYKTPKESVQDYLRITSELSYYRKFQSLVLSGVSDRKRLVVALAPKYSEAEGEKYAKAVLDVIKSCNLHQLDSI